MKKIYLFVICLIFFFSILNVTTLYAGTYNGSAEYLLKYAKDFYEKGNKPEAIHEFRKVLIVDPVNREAISYLQKLGVDVSDYLARAEEYEKRMGLYKEKKAKKPPVITKQHRPIVKKSVPPKRMSKVKTKLPTKRTSKVKTKLPKKERFLSEDELKDEVIKELSEKFVSLEDNLKKVLADRDALLRDIETMKEDSMDAANQLKRTQELKDAQMGKVKKQLADSRDALDSLSDDYDLLTDEIKQLRKIKGYPDIRVFDADIKVRITPTIKDDKSVVLKIDPSTVVTSDYKDYPSLIAKDEQKIINVKSGDSITLTGLRCKENNKHTYKVPLSTKLLLLGQLFEKDAVSSSRKRIPVSISPEISK